MSMLGCAIAFAAEKHKLQLDKGGKPYILHPLKVMYYLKSDDEELNCIAVLHDVLEDTNTTVDDLYNIGMTYRVVSGVVDLTKKDEPQENYLTRISSNVDAVRVKMADLRHNSDIRRLKGVSEKDLQRINKYNIMYEHLKTVLLNIV